MIALQVEIEPKNFERRREFSKKSLLEMGHAILFHEILSNIWLCLIWSGDNVRLQIEIC